MDALELDLEVPDDATPEMVAAKVWLAGRKLTTDQREALLKATNGHDPGTVAAAEKRAKGIYYAIALVVTQSIPWPEYPADQKLKVLGGILRPSFRSAGIADCPPRIRVVLRSSQLVAMPNLWRMSQICLTSPLHAMQHFRVTRC